MQNPPNPQSLAIIEAPSVLGLRPGGVSDLPRALRGAGLLDGFRVASEERLDPPEYDEARDPDTAVLNPTAIARYSLTLADAVESALDQDLFPLVLGGDCTILLGNLLALRRRGRPGLLFLDGHTDFYQPSAEPRGEAASMELALATGRGPATLTDLEGRAPLVRDEDVVAFAFRDEAESSRAGMQPLPEAMHTLNLSTIRELGIEAATHQALTALPAAYWTHLDADVLHDNVMPAVDYRQPDGLTWPELDHVLTAALTDDRCRGLDVTIFNPHLDPTGTITTRFTECLRGALSARAITQ
ncbi:Arginase/agmatinase/formiminoglutamase [Streptomyces davaonensis JCM 4913]|uniref:Arginase/agmatinase/formiminoglutamase n=1 Tax=Streptomyces davaonensis (strain DSM 101723 / JCM 4913 / KCC S-0913 / 768) TaxID=1214101 RepID=K4R281_STRDJ|nr:arginase family protein [Streptomyces davaonensis]CCK27443.1 Arginase/agmatinase/formiminoglutamase [Streptomyces davaonensis JCM 4913]